MIYCVEDDDNIRELVIYTLETTGLKAKGFAEGTAFMEALAFDTPELILLDIMLPGEDGLELLKKLKNSAKTKDIPVIMVTAKGAEYDKVIGLDSGADDYVTKPFSIRELMARVRANLRRTATMSAAPEQQGQDLSAGDLKIDMDRYEVTKRGEVVELTLRELELLKFLMAQKGQVFSREYLLEKVWGYEYYGDVRTVDVTVRRLREKIQDVSGTPEYILTKRGIGYYFNEKV